jgi:hypothetical protein
MNNIPQTNNKNEKGGKDGKGNNGKKDVQEPA